MLFWFLQHFLWRCFEVCLSSSFKGKANQGVVFVIPSLIESSKDIIKHFGLISKCVNFSQHLDNISKMSILSIEVRVKKHWIFKWTIYVQFTANEYRKENILFRPIDGENFKISLATCTGVLTSSGFETPAEALFLQKKLLVVPMKNQYEQQCNALSLKQMGIPVLKKFNKNQVSKISSWVNTKQSIKVNYPDITEDILDAIILPYYDNQQIDLTEITIG